MSTARQIPDRKVDKPTRTPTTPRGRPRS